MVVWKLKLWRTAGAAALAGLAACGDGDGAPQSASPPAVSGDAGEAAIGESGGEGGGPTASAYAGLSGDQLTALRLQHLKGYVLAAEREAEADRPAEAAALVAQGLREVYDAAPDQFGALDSAVLRTAANRDGVGRAQMLQRLADAEDALARARRPLHAVNSVDLAARMVDIATGAYAQAAQGGAVDPALYAASRGAALAARDALIADASALRRRDAQAYDEGEAAMNRLVALYAGAPPTYAQILTQGSRIRLALSAFL